MWEGKRKERWKRDETKEEFGLENAYEKETEEEEKGKERKITKKNVGARKER